MIFDVVTAMSNYLRFNDTVFFIKALYFGKLFMASLLELAKISNAVYSEDLSKKTVVNVKGFGNWTCTDFILASGSLNGFQAGIFKGGNGTVVAFRGTAQTMDVVADGKLGTGMNSSYFDAGQKFVSRAAGPNVTVTGHSLGGAIAQVVANREGNVMATFNAPGVGVIASRNMLETTLTMSAIRLVGMTVSAVRHPQQAVSDITNAFGSVRGGQYLLE